MPFDTGLTPGLQLLLDDAELIEALPPERFDMGFTGYSSDAEHGECGTPACIGGWVRAWSRKYTKCIDIAGQDRWGISFNQARALMFPSGNMANGRSALESATPSQAAQAMRNLALYGDPRWETVE